MQTVGILVGVFAKTSFARFSLGCVCFFLLVYIQEMFLRGSQTAGEVSSNVYFNLKKGLRIDTEWQLAHYNAFTQVT